jgi:hypothetical protein
VNGYLALPKWTRLVHSPKIFSATYDDPSRHILQPPRRLRQRPSPKPENPLLNILTHSCRNVTIPPARHTSRIAQRMTHSDYEPPGLSRRHSIRSLGFRSLTTQPHWHNANSYCSLSAFAPLCALALKRGTLGNESPSYFFRHARFHPNRSGPRSYAKTDRIVRHFPRSRVTLANYSPRFANKSTLQVQRQLRLPSTHRPRITRLIRHASHQPGEQFPGQTAD